MPKLRLLSLFIGAVALIFAGVGVQNVYAAPIRMIINEFYRGGNLTTTDEWIEILLVEDLTATQLNTFFVGDSTGAKNAKFSAYQFTNMGTIAATFPAGTIIVVGGTGAVTQDTSYNPGGGDWNILLNSGGAFLPNANAGNNGDIAGDDVIYVDTSNTGSTISTDGFAIEIGTGGGTFAAVANVNFGASTNNTGYVLTSDFTGITTLANWSTGVASGSMTLGQPNGGANTTYITTLRTGASDTPPTASSPQDGATNVLVNSNITINFSEAVDISAGAVTLDCDTFTTTPTIPIANTNSLILDPDGDMPYSTTCNVVVIAANVVDRDGTPNNMASNYNFSFTTESAPIITPIHDVQGNGSASPIIGSTVTVEAVVIGDFQGPAATELRGFFIQEEDADVDADPMTSEGIFVFCSACPDAVNVGDIVRVTGNVSEFFNMTQITASTAGSVVVQSTGNPLPTPATINLPVVGNINDFYEPFEGMLVTFTDTLTVGEYFELARYGQIILYEGGRPYQFTHTNAPSVAGYTTHLDNLARREVILDDLNNTQNAPLPNGVFYHPQPSGFGTGTQGINYFRGGDTISNLTGILHWSFAGQSGTDAWRIRPVPDFPITFTPVNTRPSAPTITGDITVASFNVLNYFTTLDTGGTPCGPSGGLECRGADSADELTRQTDKLVTALQGLDADIFGLIEIQNTSDSSTVLAVVNALNAVVGAGTYDYVNTGAVGTDAITNAFIYKSAVVQPVGGFAIDTDTIHDRPPLAVLFEVIDVSNPSFGAQFYVVVNHFKSKGSSAGLPGDTDQGDGQAKSNATRLAQANRLITWVNSTLIPNDPDVLIIGDLNAYKREDPITALIGAGYTDLVELFGGATAYGYLFDGQLGYLDHALANASLLPYVTGTTEWHINADEVPVFDYNNTVDDGAGEQSFEAKPTGNNLYEVNPYRTSDHDPVLVGLTFPPSPAPIVTNAIEIVGSGSVASTNPAAPAQLTTTVNSIAVTFSTAVRNGNPADADDVENPANYIL
ncbi:MAG: ExeM/NucH family extracellular endonuclease, partial [Anaerolineae bacterium]|nr:ExeM/NucH family extracellular endonuclease [Anaerolineae bacterium]